MPNKSSQLQIRVTPAQKEMLKRLSAEADMSVSAYVLSRALPSVRRTFERHVEALSGPDDRPRAMGGLIRFLARLPDGPLQEAVAAPPPPSLSPLLANYAAGAVEAEAARRGLQRPAWTADVPPLGEPHFAWDLPALRPHLLRVTSPAFKRRRLFFVPPEGDRSR